jgi:CO/xanthine dehydrogenase Mo-binding subunit
MGSNLSLFAMESLAESLRAEAQMGPLEWKKLNLFGKARACVTGILPRDCLPPPELFDTAARISDFSRKHSAFELARKRSSAVTRLPDYFRGIGIALGSQGSGFLGAEEEKLSASLELSMDTEGKVRISQSTVPGSYALHEIWKAIAAESLGTPAKDIHIAPVCTEGGRDAGPSIFSRGVTVMTKLVADCCELLKKKRFRSPLPLSVSKTFRLPPGVAWEDKTFTGLPFMELSWAACIVELRVDPLTLVPEIEGIWMIVEGGKILNEEEARKSLETATGAAIGWALFEHMTYVDGEIPRGQFTAYRIPTACDLPTPRIEFLSAAGKPPVKGIGELAHACVPAAYVNALSQALGLPFQEIPVSLEGQKFSREAAL